MELSIENGFALVVIVLSLVGVAAGRYPVFRMNRATIAMIGAAVLVLTGILTLDEAVYAVDYNTILLLFSMMVLNINMRLAGFFSLVNGYIVRVAKTPRQLLALVILASGLLSALFLNDTIVLMFTPMVVEVALALRRNPLPYLVALATAANVGSAATLVGNPQNMLVGISSGISFIRFTSVLIVPALLGLVVIWFITVLVFRQEFRNEKFDAANLPTPHIYRPLLWKCLLAVGLMLAGFVSGMPVALAALGAASMLLFTRRLKPRRVFYELDWSLLVFFSGLFVLTDTLEVIGVTRWATSVFPLQNLSIGALAAVSVLLSNLVSNVPAVMLMSPVVATYTRPEMAWLTLALATTFAGNLTLLGSVANLIVAETAANRGVRLGFWDYLKVGTPVTVITLLIGVLWLSWM